MRFKLFQSDKKKDNVNKFNEIYTKILEESYGNLTFSPSELKKQLHLEISESQRASLGLYDDVSILENFSNRLYKSLTMFNYDQITKKFTLHDFSNTSNIVSKFQYVFGLAFVVEGSVEEQMKFWFSLFSLDGISLTKSELRQSVLENIVLYYFCHHLEQHLIQKNQQLTDPDSNKVKESGIDSSAKTPMKNKIYKHLDEELPFVNSVAQKGCTMIKESVSTQPNSVELQEEKTNDLLKKFTDEFKQAVLDSILNSFDPKDLNTIEDVSAWMNNNGFNNPLKTLLQLGIFSTIFIKDVESNKYLAPLIRKNDSMSDSLIYTPFSIWRLTNYLSLNSDVWKLSYSSRIHGLSMNRFEYHVGRYEAPNLLFIHTTQGRTFGAYTTLPWVTRPKFKKDDESFIFSLFPSVVIKHTVFNGVPNHVYFYIGSDSFNKIPSGIGFGGNLTDSFKLCLYDDLSGGTIKSYDQSYESGAISDANEFSVAFIEVWNHYKATDSQVSAVAEKRKSYMNEWNNSTDRFMLDLIGKSRYSEGLEENKNKED